MLAPRPTGPNRKKIKNKKKKNLNYKICVTNSNAGANFGNANFAEFKVFRDVKVHLNVELFNTATSKNSRPTQKRQKRVKKVMSEGKQNNNRHYRQSFFVSNVKING